MESMVVLLSTMVFRINFLVNQFNAKNLVVDSAYYMPNKKIEYMMGMMGPYQLREGFVMIVMLRTS